MEPIENELPQEGENQDVISDQPRPGRKDTALAKSLEVLGYGIGRGVEGLANFILPQAAEIDLDIPDYEYGKLGVGYDILNFGGEMLPSMPIGSGLAAGTKGLLGAGKAAKTTAKAKAAAGFATRPTKIVGMEELAKGAQFVAQNKTLPAKAADFAKSVGYEAYKDGLTAFIALDKPLPDDFVLPPDFVMESLNLAYEEDDSQFETRLKNFIVLSSDTLVAGAALGAVGKAAAKYIRQMRSARKSASKLDGLPSISPLEDMKNANGSGKFKSQKEEGLFPGVSVEELTSSQKKAQAAFEDFSAADKYFEAARKGEGSAILAKELDSLGPLPAVKGQGDYARQLAEIEQVEFAVDVSMRKGAIAYAEALNSGDYDTMVAAVEEMGKLYTAKGHTGNYNKQLIELNNQIAGGRDFTEKQLEAAIKKAAPEVSPSSTLGAKLMELHTLRGNQKEFMARAKDLKLTMEIVESGGMNALSKWESQWRLRKISDVGAAAKMNNVLGMASIGRSILGNSLASAFQGTMIKLGNMVSPKAILNLTEEQAKLWKQGVDDAFESRLTVIEAAMNSMAQVGAAAKVHRKPVQKLIDTSNVDSSLNVLDAAAASANLQGFPAWLANGGARAGNLSLGAMERIDSAVKAEWGKKQLIVKNRTALMNEGMDYASAQRLANEHADAMVSGDITRGLRAEQDVARLKIEKASGVSDEALVVKDGPFQGLGLAEVEAVANTTKRVQENTKAAMLMKELPKPIGPGSMDVLREESFIRYVGGAFSQVLQAIPGANWITQFNKVIFNGTDIAWNASGNGLVSGASVMIDRAIKRADFDLTDYADSAMSLKRRLAQGGEEGAKAMAYLQTGAASTMAGLGIFALWGDRITGNYLTYQKALEGESKGRPQNSIMIESTDAEGNPVEKHYRYDTLDHFGQILTLFADTNAIISASRGYGDEKTAEDIATALVVLISTNLMAGEGDVAPLETIINAASNDGLLNYLANSAEKAGASVIPLGSLRKDVGKVLSEEQISRYSSLLERVKGRGSVGRTARRDPITFKKVKASQAEGSLEKGLEFFGLTEVKVSADPVIRKEFRDINYSPPQLPVTYKGIDLLDEKYDIDGRSAVHQLGELLEKEKGLTVRQELRRKIKEPLYKKMAVHEATEYGLSSPRHEELDRVYQSHYRDLLRQLSDTNPALRKALVEKTISQERRSFGGTSAVDDPRDKRTDGSSLENPFNK